MVQSEDQLFSLGEVGEVLGAANIDPEVQQMILSGLRAMVGGRSEMEPGGEWRRTLSSIVEGWQRAAGSDHNIEGVYSDLEADCYNFLIAMADVEERSSLQQLCAMAAATTYFYLRAENFEIEPEEVEMLRGAGIDEAELLNFFKQGIKQVNNIENDPELGQEVESVEKMEELPEILGFNPGQWELLVGSKMRELKTAAEAEGITFRELNQEGKYDNEED